MIEIIMIDVAFLNLVAWYSLLFYKQVFHMFNIQLYLPMTEASLT